jgi:hypothetical protein
VVVFTVFFWSVACDRAEEPTRPAPAAAGSRFVGRDQQEEGLVRCGEMLEAIPSSGATPSFARLARECGGMFRGRACRRALAAEPFSREAVATACRQDYCSELRPAPSFCAIELATDSDFLAAFGEFSRPVLARDLERIMDAQGA